MARRKTLYSDGFTPKGHRPLMQFLLTPVNGATKLKGWEHDFQDILAYLETLKAPRWPFAALDPGLVARGKAVFEASCAKCHGTYGETRAYPERAIPLADVGTDPMRLQAILPAQRRLYADSWFTGFDPDGRHDRDARLRGPAAGRHLGQRALPAQRERAHALAPAPPGGAS